MRLLYLLGSFTLETAAKGFCIKSGLPDIQPGDWTRQGLPFYSGSIVYRYEVDVPSGTQAWRIAAPQYEGALARVYCDGQLLGPIAFPPYSLESPCPAPGKHEIGIEVVSDLRNLLGPYFGGNQHSQYWAWRSAPVHEVPGEHYQPISQGLLSNPIVTYLR